MTATGQANRSSTSKSQTAGKRRDETDWERVRNMSDEEVIARAMADPDALPMSDEDFARMKPRPRTLSLRRAFHMSREEFSQAFRIPLETLRDWEEGKSEPTAMENAYLRVIMANKDMVMQALNTGPKQEAAE